MFNRLSNTLFIFPHLFFIRVYPPPAQIALCQHSDMRTTRYNSARVSAGVVSRSGLVEAAYSGALTKDAFSALRREVLYDTGPAPCVVLRMDKSLTLMTALPDIPAGTYTPTAPSGAVIVRADQYEMWTAYNRKLSRLGVMRAVFLDSHASLAYGWAERQIRELRRAQPS